MIYEESGRQYDIIEEDDKQYVIDEHGKWEVQLHGRLLIEPSDEYRARLEQIKIESSQPRSVEEIDAIVIRKIRERYSIDDEQKAARLFRVDPNAPYVLEMDIYIESCVQWGRDKKIELGFI